VGWGIVYLGRMVVNLVMHRILLNELNANQRRAIMYLDVTGGDGSVLVPVL
jgi:hypothetical protein